MIRVGKTRVFKDSTELRFYLGSKVPKDLMKFVEAIRVLALKKYPEGRKIVYSDTFPNGHTHYSGGKISSEELGDPVKFFEALSRITSYHSRSGRLSTLLQNLVQIAYDVKFLQLSYLVRNDKVIVPNSCKPDYLYYDLCGTEKILYKLYSNGIDDSIP